MEIKTLALLATVLLAATQLDSANNTKFAEFKSFHGKQYSTEAEETMRVAIFNENVAKIEAHNADSTQTYTMGVNQFTDMTQEEFESKILMPATEASTTVESFVQVGNVNWVTAGAVQAVKDQGRCGSCWAFAAVAVAESFKFLRNGSLGLFSDQQVNSCDPLSSGCNGGWHHWALQYMAGAGICTQASYPYTSGTTGQTGSCQASSCTKDSFTIRGYTTISGLSGLMSQLDASPVSVAVDAGMWSSYSSGIFSNCGRSLNHAVLAAGYTSSYTLIKNSWGAFWGESGYIRLAPGNTCGVADRNYIPSF